ncbi:PLDc domain-containing protein [Naegleria gruberi]|uniref:Mitochondrial cardiolipin hydrolase n=1 Tax=Naegleria gruberi TaxID=5762 RepID=D2VP64_NAEGR|nr:PLDc domain-containing protein [Naegleria gruberi]EFC41378.1 PLDc domain-containing protein [Naegleria gruberi]|eukprot:XP_002674122.1 PLDc domain-containing protein [Naegleria gruberi strain NEG-M]
MKAISKISLATLLCAIILFTTTQLVLADLQNTTYNSPFLPLNIPRANIGLTPLFSPDHSTKEETELVMSAKKTIDIAIPGFDSWSGCTYPKDGCMGCSATDLLNNEKFPIFQVLINQIVQHGVKVRLLTNKYDDKMCSGKMDLLTYLKIAGADVRYYTTTTFLHAKYITIDGCKSAISSINFSQTSFRRNREAGILVNECNNAAGVVKFSQGVFEYDFFHGVPLDVDYSQYSKSDIHMIQTSTATVTIPENMHFANCDASSGDIQEFNDNYNISISASPDYAYGFLMSALNQVKKSLKISIYEISHPDLCDYVIQLGNKGINLKIFASHYVFAKSEALEAYQCYRKLVDNNINVVLSAKQCLEFSHEKYWVIDDNILMMSTGNWRGSDYPNPPYVFPPKKGNSSTWRNVNRDFTLRIDGQTAILKKFLAVLDNDYQQGYPYSPSTSTSPIKQSINIRNY